ncbi:MAG: S-adenosyl-l-methionine hydroxide adenosyltransferase family protein [Pseudomonadota bacterium]
MKKYNCFGIRIFLKKTTRVALLAATLCYSVISYATDPLVLQSDFGVKDAAVASMKGVAVGVSRDIDIYDLTHEVPAYNIWEASLRLAQAAEYWPKGTVFVSVVDPGVGTARKSVVLKTKFGHYYVTPDNGSLTAVAEQQGIEAVREIDEAVNRLKNSEKSYTFHGRDVYAYTGARLAAGVISFEQVGQKLPNKVMMIPYQKPQFDGKKLVGNIEILDPQYGNIWTNIDRDTFNKIKLAFGDKVNVKVSNEGKTIFEGAMPYSRSFGEVAVGETLMYLNSLNNVSLAVNQGNFSEKFQVLSGASWSIEISR